VPPPSARAKLLDAFVTLVLEQGERAATLDAVAAAAGVSKGGLLYHFKTKDVLVDALATYVEDLAAADAATMRTAPEGPAAYYVRTSRYEDTPLDRAIVATMRLSQGENERARAAIERIHGGWRDALVEEVADAAVAHAVMLIGDGLYYHAALTGGTDAMSPKEMDALLEVVRRLIGTSG
jgi:AcrR family transcriptional regulator